MTKESGPSPRNDFGSLQSCFVEGTGEQRARERRIRRRALLISIAVQAAILTAIILVPLFGKPERLAFAEVTPLPPYYHQRASERTATAARPAVRHTMIISDRFLTTIHIPQHIDENPGPASPEPPGIPSGLGPSAPCAACIPLDDGRPQPLRPADVRPQPPKRLFKAHLEQAMLIERVEPVYPPLAWQIRREGRVELHALIATDGTIQSLQVVSGDQLFLRSALNAVQQWRYHPTLLNGQPVEIETYITVIYSLQQ
ncbi:MAG: TonB family protein [Candidatus Acidiferrum sp.]